MQLISKSKLRAKRPLKLALKCGALNESTRTVSTRKVVYIYVIVAVLILGVFLGRYVLCKILVKTASRCVGLTAEKNDGCFFAPEALCDDKNRHI